MSQVAVTRIRFRTHRKLHTPALPAYLIDAEVTGASNDGGEVGSVRRYGSLPSMHRWEARCSVPGCLTSASSDNRGRAARMVAEHYANAHMTPA